MSLNPSHQNPAPTPAPAEDPASFTNLAIQVFKSSFSAALVVLSSMSGGIEANDGHAGSCGGCPACMPPPRVEVIKEKKDEDGEGEAD